MLHACLRVSVGVRGRRPPRVSQIHLRASVYLTQGTILPAQDFFYFGFVCVFEVESCVAQASLELTQCVVGDDPAARSSHLLLLKAGRQAGVATPGSSFVSCSPAHPSEESPACPWAAEWASSFVEVLSA